MRNLHSGDEERQERQLKKNPCFVRQEKQKGKGEKLGSCNYIYIYIKVKLVNNNKS
jgi:hypothetical protein